MDDEIKKPEDDGVIIEETVIEEPSVETDTSPIELEEAEKDAPETSDQSNDEEEEGEPEPEKEPEKPKKPSIIKRFFIKLGNNIPLLLSFFIPLFVMIVVFMEREIFPFGDRSFLRTDLYHQYAPFYKQLLEKLQSGGSLLYTWQIGNGSNFFAISAYYLCSPLNILLLLCPSAYVIEFITYGIVLKISLAGFTMGLYLKKHNKSNNFAIPMFSTFYALSGYIAAYSWNIMWLDCILLFPLIIWGLERMFKENKCLLYCITLALAIATNYYISIMICISLVIYFIMLMIISPTKKTAQLVDSDNRSFTRIYYTNYPRKILQFGVYSLLAGGMAAVMLLPTYYAIKISASANSTFPTTFSSYFSILEMLARHLDNVDIHLGLEHWPNIFCSAGIFLFIPLYVMNRRVSAKEKITYFLVLLFFLASFSMNFLNFIWHGFHYPNSLPARQSFVYIFLLICMAYKGCMGIKDRSMKQITMAASIAVGFVLVFEALYGENEDWNFPIYYVSILFIALYGILVYLYRKYKNGLAFIITIGLVAVFGESFMNTTVTSVTTINRPDYVEYDNDYAALEETASQISDLTFYRMEKLKLRTKNDGSWYGYQTMSVFSSTANASMSTYYKTLGMESATNAYSKTGATVLIDMLFAVKYEMSNVSYDDNGLRKLVAASGEVKMYENTYTLPLGFMVPSDMEDAWYTGGSNPIDTQNNFISASTGLQNLYSYVTVPTDASVGQTVTVTAEQEGYYYAYALNSSIDNATTSITRNGESVQSTTHSSLKRRFIMDIGYAKVGDTITITTSDDDQTMYVSLYVLNEDVLSAAYEELASQGLNVTSYTDTTVDGEIDVEHDGLLYTSIAYENGWTAYVDGQKVETVNFKDAMLALNLTAGHHTIHLEYSPEGFDMGWKLSILSIALLVLLTFIKFLLAKYASIPSPFVDDIYPDSDEDEDEEEEDMDAAAPGNGQSVETTVSDNK